MRVIFGLVLLSLVHLAGPAPAQVDGNTVVRVQELEEEVRRLNGRIEALENRLGQIAADAASRLGDIDFRLTDLEGGDTSLVGDPAPLGTGGAPASTGSGPAVAVSERAELDRAVAEVNRGAFADGRARLEAFMTTYRGGPLVGEAEHWIGESYFRQSNYRDAAQIFLRNVQTYPGSGMAAESLLKLGLSLERLDRLSEACLTLDEVARRYPGETATIAQAQEEKARFGCL